MGTFLNAVKNLINSLTAKTSSTASTADMVQLHDANGNPNGKISLADLASVLGGARKRTLSNGTDLNTLTAQDGPVTVYTANSQSIAASLVNKPNVSFTVGITVFIITGYASASSYLTQIIVHKSDMYIRHKLTGDWQPWKVITGEYVS